MDDAATYDQMKQRLKVSIEKYFRPEFLNRLDDTIVFHSLTKENLKQIVDIEMTKVKQRLRERGLELILTDEAKEFIIEKGYNPDYGARPLRRAVENMIEDPLSESILRGEFKGMDTLTVKPGDNKLTFEPSKKAQEQPALAGSSGEDSKSD
jgi:ATP-dependent Clp protease ATP-binding subunit ClpC